MSLRILLVQQEWPRDFHRSTQWSYISSLGYIEALEACGAEVTLLTTPWIPHAPLLFSDTEFDQIWVIDLVHLEASESFFSWIKMTAPVRVGVLGESLEHTPEEIRDTPVYAAREQHVASRAAQFTHLLPIDERDARRFSSAGKPALWNPAGMLRSFVVSDAEVRPDGPVGFVGDLYPKRVRFFQEPTIADLVVRVMPRDRTPELEARYLELAAYAERPADSREKLLAVHHSYNQLLVEIRREIYQRYLAALPQLGATINPPSVVKSYPGRVYEAISQGVPVITWRVPDRPGNDRLFEAGRELLVFDDEDIDGLRRAIDLITSDRECARELALRARTRLLADHTLELRCAAALAFLEEHPVVGSGS